MIRVNLLPNAAERRGAPEFNQTWMLVVMVVVVVEIIVLFFLHQTKENELEQVQAEVARVDSQITEINNLVKDHAKIKASLAALRAREDAIARLQSGRKGPTAVLVELSRLLTPGGQPTRTEDAVKLADATADGESWDARRVWLAKYEETERNLKLEGLARDGADVFEFSQRLKESRYFAAVELMAGQQRPQGEAKLEMVKFALRVKVEY